LLYLVNVLVPCDTLLSCLHHAILSSRDCGQQLLALVNPGWMLAKL
jgi:hypothetical protein